MRMLGGASRRHGASEPMSMTRMPVRARRAMARGRLGAQPLLFLVICAAEAAPPPCPNGGHLVNFTNTKPFGVVEPNGSNGPVQFIGVAPTFAACEALCLGRGATCTSWVWHSGDGSPFARHCYSRSDGEWMPQPMPNDVCGRVNATEKPVPGAGFPASNVTYPNVPWPMPVHMAAGTTQVALALSLELTCSHGPRCDPTACEPGTIRRAVSRYARLLAPPHSPPPLPGEAVLHEIQVCVTDATEPLGPAMVENHTLSVPALAGKPILITAPSWVRKTEKPYTRCYRQHWMCI